MDEPDPLVAEYLMARTLRDEAQEHFLDLERRLAKQMEADQSKYVRWRKEGVEHSVTYVGGHTIELDERGLRKALGAKTYDKYTRKVLDRKAMEKAMDYGDVDKTTVSRFVSLRPKKAYLKYTQKEESE